MRISLVITGPKSGLMRSLQRIANVSRSPLPQKCVPRAGESAGKASRFLSSRKVDPSVPAEITSVSAVIVVGAGSEPSLSGS